MFLIKLFGMGNKEVTAVTDNSGNVTAEGKAKEEEIKEFKPPVRVGVIGRNPGVGLSLQVNEEYRLSSTTQVLIFAIIWYTRRRWLKKQKNKEKEKDRPKSDQVSDADKDSA